MSAGRYSGSIAVWAGLVAYASLYPFHPLRFPSPDAVLALFSPPRYLPRSDILFNVIAYVPLGLLACLHFRARGDRHAILKAALFGAAFSFFMEVAQLFVPRRVATLSDLVANLGGALFGALLFTDLVYSMVTRPLGALRERVVIRGAWGDAGLVLLMLWMLAQLNPALPFFGAGDIAAGSTELELLQWVAVGASTCGFGLFVSTLLVPEQGSLRVALVLLSLALWLKFIFASLMLQPNFTADWMSTGRVLGLAGGLAAFIPMRKLGRPTRIYAALILIFAGALLAKIFGAYSGLEEVLRLFRWPHGQLASFATLTRFLHELWPLAAVVFLAALFVAARRESAATVQ